MKRDPHASSVQAEGVPSGRLDSAAEREDLDGSGSVDVADLLLAVLNWG